MTSNIDKETNQYSDEEFLQRWTRIKYQEEKQPAEANTIHPETHEPPSSHEQLTDKDMPSIDSLTEESDYSGFLSPNVSEQLRKQALRKLFSSPVFNIKDGLDDYDGEYTDFDKLGDIVTADMKHQLELESQNKLQQIAESELQEQEKISESNEEPVNEMQQDIFQAEINITEHNDDEVT